MATDRTIPSIRRLIGGLQIIAKINPEAEVSAQHDVLYAGADAIALSDAELAEMDRLGWFIDRATDSWGFFT